MKLKYFLKTYNNSKIFNLTPFLIFFILLRKIILIEKNPYIIRNLISFKNVITVKVKGKGVQIFIGSRVINDIDFFIINDAQNNSYKTNKLNSEKDLNEVKISIQLTKINELNQFFLGCQNITEIDLSNFSPISITSMNGMFENCFSLISINFGNLNTSKLERLESMFKNCKSLKSLNLPYFNLANVNSMYEAFYGCNNLVYLNLSNFKITNQVYANGMFKDCSSLKLLDITNFDKENEQVSEIFSGTPNDMIVCLKEMNPKLKEELQKKCGDSWNNSQENNKDIYYLSCNGILDHLNLTNIFSNLNDDIVTDSSENIKIHSNTLDNDSDIDKETDSESRIKTTLYYNLETNKKYNLETNKDDNIETIISISEINEESFSNNMRTSLKTTITFRSSEINRYINSTKKLLEGDLISLFINNDLENFFEEIDNKKYQISTLSNQNKQNLSYIDLGNCETLLRQEYGINNTEELIIFKIENKFEGIKIPIIEYDIFSKDGKKLNLDICKNDTIKYFIPVSINENESFKYDPKSNFYNNRCDKYTTENDTDMTIYERKNEYNINNLSLCEFNCTFKGYNKNNSKVECDCIINTGINRLNMNQTELINKLKTTKSMLNMDVVQCIEILTSSEDLKSNPGFFLLIIILVIFLIISTIFCFTGYKTLKKNIDSIINKKFKENNIAYKENNIMKYNKNKIKRTNTRNSTKSKNKKQKKQNSSLKELKPNKTKKGKNVKETKGTLNTTNDNKLEKIQMKLLETDYEINNAIYKDAKKFDKRSGCEYYFSLLRYKQIFIFTFLNFSDYNSGVIKKFTLFLLIALHYAINALFFTDSNMHQIFKDNGKYNLQYQLKFIFISAMLSTALLRIILATLVLTDKSIFEIKCQPNLINANILKEKTLKCMKIKYVIFFVLNIILLSLFWYYLTCFNAIYQNTKTYLIKNTLISFAISMIYPFIINIIPAILRKIALKKSNKECLYNTSKIIQIL